ncbi:PREDICTED: metalloproteinase inhibitor 4-like [Thamnophis sirtalis]|uniref:Metalloproteinase inhibitor 4-like n=1 Tax=Thamnophis sirtalis TaxID=35019 RepID=A0A6I9Y9W5_9SAUR|nr:PREDICTED: metalloproteinase inhibitor 4-like [Thamnophis sirtalis]
MVKSDKNSGAWKLACIYDGCSMLGSVILANILSKTVVKDSPSSEEMIQYEIKQTKMFKGFEMVKEVKYVFTAISSAACGVDLEVGMKQKQYLISGNLSNNGMLILYLCDFIKKWHEVTDSQKINLKNNYQKGCDCTITHCRTEPCSTTKPHECLWTDWLKEKKNCGHQADNSACFKGSEGTCSWHNALP